MGEERLLTPSFDVPPDEVLARRKARDEIRLTDAGLIAASQAEIKPPGSGPRGMPVIDWAMSGAPELQPKPRPPQKNQPYDPLPKADVVVITWTSAEWDALHYVFSNTPPLPQDPSKNSDWRDQWMPYRRNFHTVYQSLWVRRLVAAARNTGAGAPALSANSWGSYCVVDVGATSVLLFKSELHVNQDGESLPLVQLTKQILAEVQPKLLLSVGTAGGVRLSDGLGDVVVTNAARFHLGDELAGADFNAKQFTSEWLPPEQHLSGASKLLMPVAEFDVVPPTAHLPTATIIRPSPHAPNIHLLPGVPILTTDFFEFGTTSNGLGEQGCCVEMDDAVIAMVCEAEFKNVRYGFVRNVSDPVINAAMHRHLQIAWAVLTYQLRGLYTSFNGAIATWAMIAGMMMK